MGPRLLRGKMYQEYLKTRLKDAFATYEQKDMPGSAYKREVAAIIRSAGLNPKESLLSDVMQEVNAQDMETEFISFERLEKIIAVALKERKSELIRDSKETIHRAFLAFDKRGLGYLNAQEFKEVLMSQGDPFTEEEMAEFIKAAVDKETGNIDYELYARKLAADGQIV